MKKAFGKTFLALAVVVMLLAVGTSAVFADGGKISPSGNYLVISPVSTHGDVAQQIVLYFNGYKVAEQPLGSGSLCALESLNMDPNQTQIDPRNKVIIYHLEDDYLAVLFFNGKIIETLPIYTYSIPQGYQAFSCNK